MKVKHDFIQFHNNEENIDHCIQETQNKKA